MFKAEYDKAIVDFNEAIKLDPRFACSAYCNRGIAWIAKNEYEKAAADLNEAIRIDPRCAQTPISIARFFGLRKVSRARPVLTASKCFGLNRDAAPKRDTPNTFRIAR